MSNIVTSKGIELEPVKAVVEDGKLKRLEYKIVKKMDFEPDLGEADQASSLRST